MHVITELDQVVEGGVESVQYAAAVYRNPPSGPARIRWLDGSDLELRFSVRIHHLGRWRRLGNRPFRFRSGARKIERHRRPLTPCAIDRLAVGAHSPFIRSIQPF